MDEEQLYRNNGIKGSKEEIVSQSMLDEHSYR